jgi:hypothetical protein
MTRHILNRSLWAAAFAALIFVAAPGQAAAQARRANPPARVAPQQDDGAPVAPAEIQRMLDGYELMQAQDTLQLGDDQFPRFLPRLKALQDARRRAQMGRARIVQELRRMSQARPNDVDEARVRERVSALDELEERSAAEIRQAMKAIDQVLDGRQQARFRIFEEMMEQRKVELLMRARQANRLQNRPAPRPQSQF